MRNLAKFEVIGRIGKIEPHGKVTHLTLAANYPRKNDDTGEWTDDTFWNRVTVFGERTRKQIADQAKVGDLVRVEGRMRDSSYEKDGETIYTCDRIVDVFGILAKKGDSAE